MNSNERLAEFEYPTLHLSTKNSSFLFLQMFLPIRQHAGVTRDPCKTLIDSREISPTDKIPEILGYQVLAKHLLQLSIIEKLNPDLSAYPGFFRVVILADNLGFVLATNSIRLCAIPYSWRVVFMGVAIISESLALSASWNAEV
jgi:hypothetical protein